MIRNKKTFSLGVVLTVSFFAVLWVMFLPYFGGENAFHAADRLFNTISKGSAHYIPGLMEKAKQWEGHEVDVQLSFNPEKLRDNAARILMNNGIMVAQENDALKVHGSLSAILMAALQDSESMYQNRGDDLSGRYGIPEKEVLFAWWNILKSMDKALKEQKKFKESKEVHEVIARGVEVGYNYYGISPEKASSRAGILAFALTFYVVYTLWWGFAIMYLFDGLGLEMKKGTKKEV
ncbi:MAG: hypothetical protein ACUVWY_06300 [Desulfosoma sp.]|uniref:hypothetical protein n=1 Tax=Desulfosoma sp. TaxID=2603217 RepID=UPI00404AAFD9